MWGIFRLFLALTVVGVHARELGGFHEPFFGIASGSTSVEAFFTISGYVITKSVRQHYCDGASGFIRFWWNRALRLLPPYYAALIIGLCAAPVVFSNGSFLSWPTGAQWFPALFIIGQTGLFERHAAFTEPVSVSWTIAVEVFYYFLISAWSARSKSRTTIFLIVSLVACLGLGARLPWSSMYFVTIFQAFPFAAGAYLAFADVPKLSSRISLVLVSLCAAYVWVGQFSAVSFYGCVPFTIAAIVGCENLPQTALTRYLGDLSYPVYIVQYSVMGWLTKFSSAPFVFAAFAAILSISVIINRLIEAPIARIRGSIRRGRAAFPAVLVANEMLD